MDEQIMPETRPRCPKTNISKITRQITDRINDMGFDIYVTYSKHSKSRYFDIPVTEENRIQVRLSDHPTNKQRRYRYNFDIYTIKTREGAMNYLDFLDAFEEMASKRGITDD